MESQQPKGKISKGLVEFFFWYCALVALHAVTILLKLLYMQIHGITLDAGNLHHSIAFVLFANNVPTALAITLLNRLLQIVLRKFE